MTSKKPLPKFQIFFALLTLGGLLFLFNEIHQREVILNETLENNFSIEKNAYDVEYGINQFGYLYRLKFKDEKRVDYEFFVKKNKEKEYVVTYYGHNSKGDSPLKEDEFTTLNEGY
ncbi:hypothetical protein EVJ25_03555 [Exiguobacterium sp. SH1S4]|nr:MULTISPECIES: hypothetical protein [unclassified Exiguobacterium]TCI55012.1 hypothetical protein EVJ25_03555 [Exiguobacterium sp. SH1S4]TCI63961.1 hypothetical protein EVJ26_06080 [Exiguobacterium sp. SH3S1]TCI68159.1 hypothetical protein EVJ22_12860 [Exiguobacterium sp. SH0S7]